MIQSYMGKTPIIGKNVYIAPTAMVIGDVEIGDDCSIWPSAVVRGDMSKIVIKARTNIQDGAIIHVNPEAPTLIGCDVTIGHLAMVHSATIEDQVLIGIAAVVLDGAYVESHSLIAAGTLVTPRTQIKSGSMMVGSPAVLKRTLRPEEIEHIKLNAEEYVELKNNHLKSGEKLPVDPTRYL